MLSTGLPWRTCLRNESIFKVASTRCFSGILSQLSTHVTVGRNWYTAVCPSVSRTREGAFQYSSRTGMNELSHEVRNPAQVRFMGEAPTLGKYYRPRSVSRHRGPTPAIELWGESDFIPRVTLSVEWRLFHSISQTLRPTSSRVDM